MQTRELLNLLSLNESATIEFKRDMYAIYSKEPRVSLQQRGELIKDILSLANGSFDTVGQEAYLIVGVEDNREPDGERKIKGVEGTPPSRDDLLKMVREVSNPPLLDLDAQVIEYKGKNLWVVTIPVSPNVHETTKGLETPKTNHFANMVFIRRNSTIDNASTNERIALEKLKKIHIDQKSKAPSVIVEAIGGSFFLSTVMGKNTKKITDGRVSYKAGFMTGLIIGAFSGGSIGYSLDQFVHILHEIRKVILLLLLRKK